MLKQFESTKQPAASQVYRHEIIPNLFLGSVEALQQIMTGNQDNFDCVITVLDEAQIRKYYDQAFMTKSDVEAHLFKASDNRRNCGGVELENKSANELAAHFEPSSSIIEKALKEGKKILVHCHSGVNRSASLVINYLLTKEGLTWREANKAIVPKRGIQLTRANRANLLTIAKSLETPQQDDSADTKRRKLITPKK